ncbi:hypothetical protein HDE_04158 [Halotydeus destructor]|nr:hypothetical protein HDE_04158 [Halotydeus destructor]
MSYVRERKRFGKTEAAFRYRSNSRTFEYWRPLEMSPESELSLRDEDELLEKEIESHPDIISLTFMANKCWSPNICSLRNIQSTLTTLNIDLPCEIFDYEGGMDSLKTTFSHLVNLTQLELTYRPTAQEMECRRRENFHRFLDIVCSNCSLKKLDIQILPIYNFIDDYAADLIGRLESLEQLDIMRSAISAQGQVNMISKLPKLYRIKLNDSVTPITRQLFLIVNHRSKYDTEGRIYLLQVEDSFVNFDIREEDINILSNALDYSFQNCKFVTDDERNYYDCSGKSYTYPPDPFYKSFDCEE